MFRTLLVVGAAVLMMTTVDITAAENSSPNSSQEITQTSKLGAAECKNILPKFSNPNRVNLFTGKAIPLENFEVDLQMDLKVRVEILFKTPKVKSSYSYNSMMQSLSLVQFQQVGKTSEPFEGSWLVDPSGFKFLNARPTWHFRYKTLSRDRLERNGGSYSDSQLLIQDEPLLTFDRVCRSEQTAGGELVQCDFTIRYNKNKDQSPFSNHPTSAKDLSLKIKFSPIFDSVNSLNNGEHLNTFNVTQLALAQKNTQKQWKILFSAADYYLADCTGNAPRYLSYVSKKFAQVPNV